MQEIAQLRVLEKYAHLVFQPHEGKLLGDNIRHLHIPTSDPRYHKIGVLQEKLGKKDELFFTWWHIQRRYTTEEIDGAELFHLDVGLIIQAGEEYGTQYDDSTACRLCSAGATQVGPLIMSSSRLPKSRDLAVTMAGEMVVSRRVVDLFERLRLNGADFEPVRHQRRADRPASGQWFQMRVRNASVQIHPKTVVANDPFDMDPDNEGRCPRGHLLGLNLISEVYVTSGLGDVDVAESVQYFGYRLGLYRPTRFILISPKLRSALAAEGLKRWTADVAYVVRDEQPDHAGQQVLPTNKKTPTR